MPLLKSGSEKAKKDNFSEWRHGRTFSKTAAKFGKERARKQMTAVVLKNQREHSSKSRPKSLRKRSRGKKVAK
jgi:hypothetical protein